MEQTKALNALEPFLALSKSATSPRAASDLISQATSAPNTYVFAELLQTPNIQNLRSSEEYASYLTLLEIFAWGTWEDYKCMFAISRCGSKSVHPDLTSYSTAEPTQALGTATSEALAPLPATTIELTF
jgi:COP9 signalosome complex subunit 7